MNRSVSIHPAFILLILGAIIAILFLISTTAAFQNQPDTFSLAITLDLILTIPLVYFILIRKKSIPNFTVLPVMVLGIILAGIILPAENQYYLELVKTWFLPVIELTLIGIIIYKVRKASLYFKSHTENHTDYFTLLKEACSQIVPKAVVHAFATEIAIFYYGFINWKSLKISSNQFTYHRETPTRAILVALIFLVGVETVVFHILLSKWSETAALVLAIISIYSGFQVYGLLRSLSKRPYSLEEDQLILRYGIFGETHIPYEFIDTFEINDKDFEKNDKNRKLSILGDLEAHNYIIGLNTENTLSGFYGIRKKYMKLAFHVDDVKDFHSKLQSRVHLNT